MTSFERGDVVFDDAGESHHFDSVGAQTLLMVIAQRDEEKEPREKCNDDNPDSGARQQFEMKMLWTKKPGDASPENSPANVCGWVGRVGLRHYKFQKAGILPLPLERGGRPSVGGSKAKSVPDADQK